MRPAALGEAADEDVVGSFQEEEGHRVVLLAEMAQDLGEVF
jgi:hypothetical protein